MSTKTLVIIPASSLGDPNIPSPLSFTIPLYGASAPDDSTPVDYWCSLVLTAPQHTAMESYVASVIGAMWFDYPSSDPLFPRHKLTDLGLRLANGGV